MRLWTRFQTWRRQLGVRAALMAHQAATGHRGTFVTRYSDGRVIEHCMECEYGLPDPR